TFLRITALRGLCPQVADWKAHGENCACSFSGAFCLDGSAVELYEVVSDREAEAKTAISSRRCAITLNKRFEDMRQKFLIDALAGIADAKSNFRFIMLQGNLDAAVLRGELDGVADEVRENLLETFTIAENFGSSL